MSQSAFPSLLQLNVGIRDDLSSDDLDVTRSFGKTQATRHEDSYQQQDSSDRSGHSRILAVVVVAGKWQLT